MYVERHMTAPAVVAGEGTTAAEARAILMEKGFRHLPVVDARGRLVGMLSDRDLRSALPDPAVPGEGAEVAQRRGERPLKDLMTAPVQVLNGRSTLDDALLLFERYGFGACPVVDGELRVVGILAVRDLLRAFRGLFGLAEPGSALVEVVADSGPMLFSRIAEALDEVRIPFSRILRPPGEDGAPGEKIFLRVNTFNLHAVHRALEGRGLRSRGREGKAGDPRPR